MKAQFLFINSFGKGRAVVITQRKGIKIGRSNR